jgi:hypothetical protein
MINGIKLKDSNLSPNQRRIRLMELGGVPMEEKDKRKLQPRKGLLTESKQDELDMDEFISELMNELEEEDILREMGYYDDEDELEELHNVKVSKGYKEGRKLVDNLRRGLFRKLNNDELDDFVEVLKTSFGF